MRLFRWLRWRLAGYTSEQQRIADYIGKVGGADPIGFLIASHADLRETLEKVRHSEGVYFKRALEAEAAVKSCETLLGLPLDENELDAAIELARTDDELARAEAGERTLCPMCGATDSETCMRDKSVCPRVIGFKKR